MFPVESVDYGAVIRFKMPLLQKAAKNFLRDASAEDRRRLEAFSQTNATWVDDFALFMAVKEAHDLAAWTMWQPAPRSDPRTIGRRSGLMVLGMICQPGFSAEVETIFPAWNYSARPDQKTTGF